MGLFKNIANLFRSEPEEFDSPFSALIDDADREKLDRLNEIQRHYATSPFVALLDDKTLDKLYRMKDRYTDPMAALNADDTEISIDRVKEKLASELQKFHNVCNGAGTPSSTPKGLSFITDEIEDYEKKKYTFAQNLFEKSYPEMVEDVFEIIDKYPKIPYADDKKYFSRFRHDGNPLGVIKDYASYADELKECGFNKAKWEKRYGKYKKNSLLDNPQTVPLAEVFATFLARKAVELQDLGSIRDCVRAYAHYNANRIIEDGFDTPVIVPMAFKDPHFKSLLQKSGETDTLPLLESDTIRNWLLNEKSAKKSFDVPPLLQEDWEKIFEKWDFPEIKNAVRGVDSEASIEQMEQFKASSKANAVGKADGIFVDVDDTLFHFGRYFAKSLYDSLLSIKDEEKITIFTGGDIDNVKQRLQKAGVDPNTFPIESKEKYRNHLFTGYIIDDIKPEHQAFWMEDDDKYINANSGDVNFFEKAVKKHLADKSKPLDVALAETRKEANKKDFLIEEMLNEKSR